MKFILTLALALTICQLHAQQLSPISMENKKMNSYLLARKPASLNIKFTNLPSDSKKIHIKYSLVQLGVGFQASKYAEIDASGNAKLVLDQNYPWQQIWLDVSDYLYAGIYVNEGLNITIDAEKIGSNKGYMIADGIQYSGPDGDFNTVMNEFVLFKKAEREVIENNLRHLFDTRKDLNKDKFYASVDSVRQQIVRIENEFIAKHSKYAWAIENQSSSKFLSNYSLSYWGDVMPDLLFDKISKHQPYFTDNEGILYYKYLKSYMMSRSDNKNQNGLEGTLSSFESKLTPEKADLMKLFILDDEKNTFEQSYPQIIKRIKTPWSKNIAMEEFKKATLQQKRIDSLLGLAKTITSSGIGTPLVQLPFEAELYQIDSLKNVDEFLLNLRSKYPNQAIILDFWATWCAPCLSDLPFSKSLHEANKDLPIQYVYLCSSSSSDVKIWKNKVAEIQLPGTHIFVDDKVITELKTMLGATGGFPSYVVINAKGKVDAKAISRIEGLNRETVKQAVGL